MKGGLGLSRSAVVFSLLGGGTRGFLTTPTSITSSSRNSAAISASRVVLHHHGKTCSLYNHSQRGKLQICRALSGGGVTSSHSDIGGSSKKVQQRKSSTETLLKASTVADPATTSTAPTSSDVDLPGAGVAGAAAADATSLSSSEGKVQIREMTMEEISKLPPLPVMEKDYVFDIEEEEAAALAKENYMDDATKELVATNPLLKQEGLPRFSQITPKDVVPAIEYLISDLEKKFSKYEEALKNPTDSNAWGRKRMLYDFEDVVEEMERITDPLGYAWGVVAHLNGVKNSDKLREAYQAMQPKVITLFQRIEQSVPVFEAYSFLQKPGAKRLHDEAQQRIVDRAVLSKKLAGVGLDGEVKERFNAIQLELADLGTKFNNNALDATKSFHLTVTAKEDIEGLPETDRQMAAAKAKAAGEEEATAETGPWRLTLDQPSYMPVMQHLKSRKIREQMYMAYITRASSLEKGGEGKFSNEELIKRILDLRAEMSSILGFKNYAEKSLATKMASGVEEVYKLTDLLKEKALPAAKRELKELEEYAVSKGGVKEGEKLALWDVTYWTERLKEEKYEFKEEEIRPYFPLSNVLEGMFDLASRLFGVKIVAAPKGSVETWHPDVTFYNVYEESRAKKEEGVEGEEGAEGKGEGGVENKHIASFYLDPYVRPEDKRGGAWMDDCVGKSKVMDRIPVAYLTCNGPPEVEGKPSLMSFREVETLFHEFGHGLQHMLTRVEHAGAAGINNIEWDAVELPSQFMENWCYHRPTVNRFARHYETGESLPQDLFDKLVKQRTYMAGSMMMRQLYFSALDMDLHHHYVASEHKDDSFEDSIMKVQGKIAERYTVIPPLPKDRFLCGFSHIFGGPGYAAGYYSYKYAEVMSADAFGAFEEANLADEEAIKTIGRRFRETVLGSGGGKHPREVYRQFRGRDPEVDALLRHSGLM